MYIDPKKVNALFEFINESFSKTIFMDYEMYNPGTSFGTMMVRNFKLMGINLVGMTGFPSLESVRERFLKTGFRDVEIYDMNTVYYKKMGVKELQRVQKLEWLDELEEMTMMMKHYYLLMAKNWPKEEENSYESIKIGSPIPAVAEKS